MIIFSYATVKHLIILFQVLLRSERKLYTLHKKFDKISAKIFCHHTCIESKPSLLFLLNHSFMLPDPNAPVSATLEKILVTAERTSCLKLIAEVPKSP